MFVVSASIWSNKSIIDDPLVIKHGLIDAILLRQTYDVVKAAFPIRVNVLLLMLLFVPYPKWFVL
jgi:hypothetical protein